MTDTQTLTPVPGQVYRLLDHFIGKWDTTGNMKTGEGEPDLWIEGTDTYEWLPGGFFVMHKVDVRIGDDCKLATEIIGFDASTGNYMMHSYDNSGEASVMHASEHHGIWTFASETMRFTGAFSEDHNSISGIWEYALNGQWEFLMDIKLNRQSRN